MPNIRTIGREGGGMTQAENFQIGVAHILFGTKIYFHTGFIMAFICNKMGSTYTFLSTATLFVTILLPYTKREHCNGQIYVFCWHKRGEGKREKFERNEGFSMRKIEKRCGNLDISEERRKNARNLDGKH